MKLPVKCPKCGKTGELDVPEGTWDKVQGDMIAGRILPGKICEHGFKIDFNRAGQVLAYHELDEPAEEYVVRPVKFNVKSILRNLNTDVVAEILTGGISGQTVVLLGSLAVTMGLRDFMERVLPDSVDVGALVYMVTPDEYDSLPESTKQYMTVDVRSKTVRNSPFDEEQLEWMRKVLIRANMVTNQDAAEQLILTETSKLRTTVSLLRHMASRRGAGIEGKKLKDLENESSSK